MKLKINLLVLFSLVGLYALPSFAQAPNNPYIIKQGDWLRKIAKVAYGNPQFYTYIIEGTNKKAAADNSFEKIASANDIKIGQKIWIPSLSASSTSNLTGIPQTDCEIRLWYNYQVVAIGVINEKWRLDGIALKTRAQKAYEMRHEARVNARFMMQDQEAVKALQARDMKKYGNPDGPTFDYLLKKSTNKGLSLNDAYQAIIDSSSRTDQKYNADCK